MQNFTDYEPSTINPGPALTVWTVILCVVMNVSLPIVVHFVNRWDRLNKQGRQSTKERLNSGDDDDECLLQDDDDSLEVEALISPDDEEEKLSFNLCLIVPLFFCSTKSQGKNNSLCCRSSKNGKDGSIVSSSTSTSSETDESHENQSQDGTSSFFDSIRLGAIVIEEDEEDMETSLWTLFVAIFRWDEESKCLLGLTIPFTIQGCIKSLFQMINVAIIGNKLGVMEANAYIVVGFLVDFSNSVNFGFSEAIASLLPQARGAGNYVLAGRYLQLCQLLYSLFTIPVIIIWSIWMHDIILWFGFDEETARISQAYSYPFLILTFLNGFDRGIHMFLSTMGHEHYSTVAQTASGAVQCLGVVISVSSKNATLPMIGIIQTILGFLVTGSNIVYIFRHGWMDAYIEGLFGTLSLKDGRAVHTMMITALPLSISWLLTQGEWQILSLFASFMGPAEVAAWGILGVIWDTFERITSGFADAAEVRIGFRMGAGQPLKAKLAAYKAICMSVMVALVSTVVLAIMAGHLPRWMTPDPTLQKMIFEALPLIGFGQILLSIGTVCWGIICAQGRVILSTVIEFCTSWIVVIPLCAISHIVLNYDIKGFVAALVVGYTFAGVTLGFIILRSDWRALSLTVISRNSIEGVSWQDNEWEELPTPIQTAAQVLGYTKEMWSSGEEPATSSKAWKDLTGAEREAAQILGYTKRAWDDNDDGSSCSCSSKADIEGQED